MTPMPRAAMTLLVLVTSCAHARGDVAGDNASQLAGARALFERNIRAIQERDREAYLSCYLSHDGLIRAGEDGVALGYAELAGDTPASGHDDWPESLVANDLQVHRVAEGVVYGAYRYVVVIEGARSEGWSERVFVHRDGRWWIAVTTAFPVATAPEAPAPSD